MADIRTRFMEAYAHLLKEGLVAGYKDFASKISVSTSMITEISKERSNVGMTAIQNIVLLFPINADWILTGRGSMLREDEVQQPIQPTSATSDAVSLRLMDRLEEKDVKIDQLQSELRTMEKELAVFKSKHEHNYEHPPLTDVFTGDSSKVYGKDLAPMTKPTPSKRSSVGKT